MNRTFYLLDYFYDELIQSPIIELMSEFILFEANQKGIGRGTLSDSFHLIYSFYCFRFITDDQSILDFSRTKRILDSRIHSVKANFFTVETKSGVFYNWFVFPFKKWIKKIVDKIKASA